MDIILGIIGIGYIAFKMLLVLMMIGLFLWFLVEIGSTLFKFLFYGILTVLSFIGMTWLFVL